MQICNYLYFSKSRLFLLIILFITVSIAGSSQGRIAPKTNAGTVAKADSLVKNNKDTVGVHSSKKKKNNQIDDEIVYSAKDSIVFLGNGTGFLHGQSDIKYKKIGLKADYVRVKMDSSLIYAKGKVDSVGKKIDEPVFNEGGTEYKSNEMTYNLKTKKAFIKQAVTQQGEGYVISSQTKKLSDDVLCMTGGKYTTCDDHEHPDFYLSLSKAKVKPGKSIVAGPAHLVICDVPLPIAIPFGFFPFTNQYSSGVLMPTYADDLNRGFGLINGGYYFAINDYVDMEARGEIYTKGTWSLNARSTYRKRYKYNGSFNFSLRTDVTGEKDMPDYARSKSMNIQWSHSQDSKANPYFNFSSSVNFSTSGYDQRNINNYTRPELNSNNSKNSSVSFTKRFPENPFTISGSMNISQNTRDSTIDLTLPNISISMGRIYPFKRKNPVGQERWYEKISLSYTGSLANNIRTKEDKLLHSSFSKDWKNGMRHSIPVSATFNVLKYINITPGFNYNERWYLQSINRSWDNDNQRVKNDTTTGFYRVYDFDMGVSASTKLYGNYIPLRSIFGNKVERIRHVMTPSINFNFRPDFGTKNWGYYDTYMKTVADNTYASGYRTEEVQYSHYEGSMYGAPGTGKSGSIGFSLKNNVEMKVRNDNDTTTNDEYKKISLIDDFTVNGAYNLAADSMNWSNFSTSLRIKLTKNYSLNLSGAFDPYLYRLNSNGDPVRVNELCWNHGKFPHFLGTSTSFNYRLSNDTFKKKDSKKGKDDKNKDNQNNALKGNPNDPLNKNANGNDQHEETKSEQDADGYDKSPIQWSIDVNYSVRYEEIRDKEHFNKQKMNYELGLTHNASFSANLSLTSNWNFSTSTSYDFKAKKIAYTSINVSRKLHCWTMTGSFVPFGPYKTYNFHIGVNASMLQDLKYDKRSGYSSNNISWY